MGFYCWELCFCCQYFKCFFGWFVGDFLQIVFILGKLVVVIQVDGVQSGFQYGVGLNLYGFIVFFEEDLFLWFVVVVFYLIVVVGGDDCFDGYFVYCQGVGFI